MAPVSLAVFPTGCASPFMNPVTPLTVIAVWQLAHHSDIPEP